MAITQSQPIDRRLGNKYQFPVAAATLLYAGGLGALDGSNRLVMASDAAARRCLGPVFGEVDNRDGAAGDLYGEVEVGIFKLDNDGDAPVTDDHIGQPCFVKDNATVSASPGTHGVVAGLVRKVDDDGVWVDFSASLRHAGFLVASGTHAWAGGAATTDSIPVPGLLATDTVLVTLAGRSAAETLAMAVNDHANDQIDLTLSANGANGTTLISYLVIRPTA